MRAAWPSAVEVAREVEAAAAAADDQRPHSPSTSRSKSSRESGGRPFLRAAGVLDPQHLRDVLLGQRVLAASGARGQLRLHLGAQPGLGDLLGATGAAPAIDGLGHLLEVVDLVLVFDLRRPRRAPVDLVQARARVEDPEQDDADEEAPEEDDHDDDERVHADQPTGGGRAVSALR